MATNETQKKQDSRIPNSSETVDVTIGIPCFNPTSEKWLALAQYISEVSNKTKLNLEFIIVDDGSFSWVPAPASLLSQAQVVQLPSNQGKGAALKKALSLASTSSKVFSFTDFDVPYPADELIGVVSAVYYGNVQACIGDRTYNESYSKQAKLTRSFSHLFFRLLVRTIVTGGYSDSQCGLKAYQMDIARELVKTSKIDGFLFDLEWLYICLHHYLTVEKWPVHLNELHVSSPLRFFGKPQMFFDLFSLVRNVLSKSYDNPQLLRLAEKRRGLVLRAALKSEQSHSLMHIE